MPTHPDPHTGHWPGWVPVSPAPQYVWHRSALEHAPDYPDGTTLELVGPKVQKNPHGLTEHVLLVHGSTKLENVPTDFDELRLWLSEHVSEGVVWHHPDGRMAKIKAVDFGLKGHDTSQFPDQSYAALS